MNKRETVEIVIRIYALYLLIYVVWGITSIVSAFTMDYSEIVANPVLYRAWLIALPFIYLLVAMILLSKSKAISMFIAGKSEVSDSNIDQEGPSHTQLSFWIILIGLYLLVSSASSLIEDIVRTPIQVNDMFMWSILISKGFSLIIAYYMTFKSHKVEKFIMDRQRQ